MKFVPNNVTHMEFWQRYLFKRALLEDALANAEIAERRSKIEINSIKSLSPRKNLIQTEQPKLTLNENDKNDENNDNNKNKSDIKEQNEEQQKKQQKLNNPSSSSTLSSSSSDIENLENELMNDNNLNWNDEEIPNNVELSEEEQIRLLEQYEQEIQEREKKRNENNSNNKGKVSKSREGNIFKILIKFQFFYFFDFDFLFFNFWLFYFNLIHFKNIF